ncbi:MAG: DNA alkylation repair protein [Planctomycetaceae bacterium]
MNATDILRELSVLGAPGYKKILLNHGAQEPVLGVKISELKKFQKQIKKDYALSLELYKTGVYDAQYLAGLIADETKMTKADLRLWLSKANCMAISGTAVAWVAAESKHGHSLAQEWIDSPDENAAHTGWLTLAALTSLQRQSLDPTELEQWLRRVEQTIHRERNQVRYAMNQFVICVGSYVADLTDAAIATAGRIGRVSVDMGATACAVPSAADYIQKVRDRGAIGKKRKTVRC